MELFNAYFLDTVKNKYAQFDGRARRSEYWYFALFNFLISIVAGIIDAVLTSVLGFGFIGAIVSLALLVPGIAVAVRRLHDVGKSGWFLLIALVPLLGLIYLIYLMVQDSQPGDNEFGANPKGVIV